MDLQLFAPGLTNQRLLENGFAHTFSSATHFAPLLPIMEIPPIFQGSTKGRSNLTGIAIPPNMPRRGNPLTRAIGRAILGLYGWKIAGELPNEKKIIVVGGPHTSNMDFVLAMATMLALGLRFSYMMKKEAFENPLGGLFKWLGGVPIDRKDARDIPAQMSAWFNSQDKAWLGITPEGTRRKVTQFKKGYLYIAQATDAPLLIVGIDRPTKEIVIDKRWPLSGDIEADNEAIRNYMLSRFTGIKPENQ